MEMELPLAPDSNNVSVTQLMLSRTYIAKLSTFTPFYLSSVSTWSRVYNTALSARFPPTRALSYTRRAGKMALNAASHNIPGEKTGPVSGQPPSLSSDAKDAILGASQQDATGQHAPGKDAGTDMIGEKKVKSEKELEKERKKAEKDKKFREKQAAQQAKQGDQASSAKAKEKKEKKAAETLPPYKEITPRGQKKILQPLDDPHYSSYHPSAVESAWYSWWEESGLFKPEFTPDGKVLPKGSFTICIPPPNVTGALHCGHALATSLQDVLIRWHRMRGFTTLYVPGCDHAGISTQSVVEKKLYREKGQTRHDLGRENFLQLTQKWKDEYHDRIMGALRRLGGSMDWSREAFTMSPELSVAVAELFVRLHDDGLIYRSNRLVNWCTALNTALSNIEVQQKEINGRTKIAVPGYERMIDFGVLTHFKYPIEGSEEQIEVATTRPETMLGDSGIAVHPDDERYKHLVGKTARHPFIEGRKLPIVADTYVDPEFGTGAVKMTPAHDPNDFELGKRHNLEFITILTDDGRLNANAGPMFKGQKRFEARYTVKAELEKLGLFVKEVDNPMKIPLCEKSKDVIEPLIKPQWWVEMKPLAEPGLDAIKDGRLRILPPMQERSYERWLTGINDWCISRQLWWGHRCPAYLVVFEGESPEDVADRWVVGRNLEEAQQRAEKKFPNKRFTLEQDPDVLDTWFSSGLWPMSTLGWPNEQAPDFQKLFPTQVLETGWDIIFHWVARMVMISLYLCGKVPFREVYCHSLIRDSEGRKMSKSLGNVVDPIDIMEGIELQSLHDKLLTGNLDPKELKTATKYQKTAFPQGIPECGTDALRFSLIQYTTGGGDIAFDVKVIHGYRRFANKIWQATKYVLGNLDKQGLKPTLKKPSKSGHESLAERWILSKLTTAARDINAALDAREFSKSTQYVYTYWYNELCDVYIENSKAIIAEGSDQERQSAVETLYTALEGGLCLIHPFMPFISEELWQRLPRRPEDETPSILKAAYPEFDKTMYDPESEAAYELLLGCSKGVRSLMSQYGIKEDGKAFVRITNEKDYQTATSELQSIRALSGKGVSSISVLSESDSPPTGCAVFVVSANAAVFVEVRGRVDIGAEIEKAKTQLQRAVEAAEKQRKVLHAPDFEEKVSEAVRSTEKSKLQDILAEQRNYEQSIEQFEKLKLEESK